ncbi:MAG: aminotransferase class I/II-fold pyridoxal phosphate-dependent enzyme [Planctomycetes bacterium]|nr:aminotransferase class I/II-fold pyridoxal phosphate-dependent enzyme [Planctomycetota bacterium]
MKPDYLAQRTSLIDASGIRKVFALAAEMDNPVNFSIGQPDFDVPEALKQEAIKAIENGFNRYSQTAGDETLRARIRSSLQAEIQWDNANVLVTSGVSGGLLLTFMTLLNPGDEVILPDPYFVIYKHLINLLGGRCVFVDSYPDFRLPVDGIRQCITERTKLIIVNSPCNPTGMVYAREELEALASVARQHDLIVMSDEIYNPFCYDSAYTSMAALYEKTLLLRGFGKAYAMTGWRLGYAAVQDCLKPLLEEMIKIQQYTFVCAPTPFQSAAIAALDYDISDLVASYKQKRDLLVSELAGAFGLVTPGGAFYAFVKSPHASATEFVKKAIANNVLIIPGNVFSEQDTHFRISYAASDDVIKQGCDLLKAL